MSLFDALSKIAEHVKQHREVMNKSEATVEQVSVVPFIDALGYDTKNPAEVRKQYAILNWDAVDFAVLRNSEPIMVIEAKKSSETLGAKFWKQLFEYFNADKARVGILTNGIEYRIYIDSAKQNIMDHEPSLTIDLDNLDKVAVAQLEGFTKSDFHPEHSLRKVKISNLLARELRSPSDEFVRFFAKQIHSGAVWQTVIEEYRPIVQQCLDEILKRKNTEPIPPKPTPENDIPIFGSYKGRRFEAIMLRRSLANGFNGASHCIRYEGKLTSGKEAMIAAIRSVDPNFNPGENQYGLGFWHVIDPADGTEHPLYIMSKHVIVNDEDEALRQRVLSS